ncbi:MAG: DUF2141 domain-containing protein [Bacteroidetes bacterium]|nr:DUF2141 domain-containing protein [Bacteroidota bacterium]
MLSLTPFLTLDVPVMKALTVFSLILALSGSVFAQQTQNLNVLVNGIPESNAPTLVMLYASGTQFINEQTPALEQQVIAAGQTRASLQFSSLQTGAFYAIMVVQDLNGNGALDRKNGRPTESYVFSETGTFIGTPSFSDVAFKLSPETSAVLLNMVEVKAKAKTGAETLSSR